MIDCKLGAETDQTEEKQLLLITIKKSNEMETQREERKTKSSNGRLTFVCVVDIAKCQ